MIVSSRALMPVIGAALMRNQHVGLTTTGSSMFPFIRSSDMVELEPLNRLPGVGDLVLARCPATPEGERDVLPGLWRLLGLAWNRCAPLNLWFCQTMNHLRRQRPRNA